MQINKPLVSIIIPTYNRGSLLNKAIDSVINQDYRNIEIIVVDDGSTDNTKDILSSYKDARLKIIYCEHRGACFARNKGIETAKGKYISFLDSDDTYTTNKISTQYKQLVESNSDIVFCSFYRHQNNTTEIIPSHLSTNTIIYYEDLLPSNFISTQTIFGKAVCFKNNLFDVNMFRFQDWELLLRLSRKYKIEYFDDILVNQYIQSDSIYNNKSLYSESILKIINKNFKSYINNIEMFNNLIQSSVNYLEEK